jgi:hypothetical protein
MMKRLRVTEGSTFLCPYGICPRRRGPAEKGRGTTATNKRRHWGFVRASVSTAALTALAKMQEDAGVAGLFAVQVNCTAHAGLPFLAPGNRGHRAIGRIFSTYL